METRVTDRQFRDKEIDSLLEKPVRAFQGPPKAGYTSLAQLDQHCLARIKVVAPGISYAKGAVLFAEEQPSGGVFVILEGRVKLSVSSSHGKCLVLGFFGPGTVLGLESSITGWPCMTTAEIVKPTVAVCMSHAELLMHMQRNPKAGIEAAEMLSESCYFLLSRIKAVELSESALEKMVGLLLGIQREGQIARAETHLQLDLSQEAMAQMIGVSRETFSRLLSRLKKQHILDWKRSTLIIRDRKALEKLAKSSESDASTRGTTKSD